MKTELRCDKGKRGFTVSLNVGMDREKEIIVKSECAPLYGCNVNMKCKNIAVQIMTCV